RTFELGLEPGEVLLGGVLLARVTQGLEPVARGARRAAMRQPGRLAGTHRELVDHPLMQLHRRPPLSRRLEAHHVYTTRSRYGFVRMRAVARGAARGGSATVRTVLGS